jgi:hypothetical protein
MQKYSWILVKEPNTTYQCFFFLGKYSHFNKKGFLCKKLPLIYQSLEKKTKKICITRFVQQIPAGSQTIKEFCNCFYYYIWSIAKFGYIFFVGC